MEWKKLTDESPPTHTDLLLYSERYDGEVWIGQAELFDGNIRFYSRDKEMFVYSYSGAYPVWWAAIRLPE